MHCTNNVRRLSFPRIAPVLVLMFAGVRGAGAAVRFDVIGSPTEVISTGRSEVLGSVQMAAAVAGTTGTSGGGATQIGMIFPGLQIDNTTTTGIKLFMSPGFAAAAPTIVSVENRDLNGACSGFLTVNFRPGAAVIAGDFIRLEGVRGRIDSSLAITPGTDLFVDLQSINDPAANTFNPDRLRVAKSLKGINAAVVTDSFGFEIRVAEGFARAFVDSDAANDSSTANDRTDSFVAALGAPTNSTQLVIRLDGIPTGISSVIWPAASTAATTGAALYLLSNTYTAGTTASSATAIYSFETPNQVSASDVVLEFFGIAPQFVFVSGRCNTDDLTASVTLGPAVAKAPACAAPGDFARPRFLEVIELQLTSISPSTVVAGTGAFTFTLNGSGFTTDSKVLWNGASRPTTFVSATRLTAAMAASDITAVGTATISVANSSLGGAVSNTLTLTIRAPSLTLLYPRLVSAADTSEVTGIALANTGGRVAAIKLTAFDRSGARISGLGVENPVTLTLAAGEQRRMLDTQVFGTEFASGNPIGWLKLETDVAQVTGFFLSFNGALTHLDGADVTSDTVTSFILPEVAENGFTQVHVANPGVDAATLTFELMKSDGTLRASAVTRTVNPNGAAAELLSDLFPGVSVGSSDYIRVTSTRGVAAFEYLGETGRDVAGLNGQDASVGARTLYSPQYAVGGSDWRSTLSVVNLEQVAGTVSLRFLSDDGVQIGATKTLSIAPRGKLALTDQKLFLDPGPTLKQGYVEVTSSVRIAGNVFFGNPGVRGFATALPLLSKLQSQFVISQVASDSTYYTGLALLNPGDDEARAVIQVFDAAGNVIASKIETIPAKGRRSKLLTELFPELAGVEIGSGYITMTVSRNVATFGLFGQRDQSVLSAVPSQVVP
jgi:hypothetical protein